MRTPLYFLAALVLLSAAGCRGSNPSAGLPTLHLVKGSVTRSGQPVNGGLLTFQPDPDIPGTIINAEVAADGRFEVQTADSAARDGKRAKGAPAAVYRVTYYPRLISDRQSKAPREYSDYSRDGIQYLIASSQAYGDAMAEPHKNSAEYSAYMRLFEQSVELVRFTPSPQHPGPELRLFKVK